MKYDFDIHWIISREVFANPELKAMLSEHQISADMRGNFIAMFRDPATVTALRGASQPVQDFFKAAGFGMNVYDSGAGDGRYPCEDEAARKTILAGLTDNLDKFPLKDAPTNGFSFAEFLGSIARATPVVMPQASTPVSRAAAQRQKSTANQAALSSKYHPLLWKIGLVVFAVLLIRSFHFNI